MREPRSGRIYGLCLLDSNEIRYIGQTTGSLANRLKIHKRNAIKGTRTPLYDWMRKYENQVKAILIEETHDVDAAEIRIIAEYKNDRLLNVTLGGTGGAWNKGIPNSEETRAKIRAAKLGKPSSPALINAVIAAHARNKLVRVSCLGCKQEFTGLHSFRSHWSWNHTEDRKAKQSKALKEVWTRPEYRANRTKKK